MEWDRNLEAEAYVLEVYTEEGLVGSYRVTETDSSESSTRELRIGGLSVGETHFWRIQALNLDRPEPVDAGWRGYNPNGGFPPFRF